MMPKVFYTETDIEDMVKRGVMTLEVNDNVVLTDLAYEKANRLGMRLARQRPDSPPSAPVRPYIAKTGSGPSSPAAGHQTPAQTSTGTATPPAPDSKELHLRIKNAVIARLGSQVDPNLLDVIIQRVLGQTGLK
jgi:hypothetical protein